MKLTRHAHIKLIQRYPLGALRLYQFATNPVLPPDYVYRHDCQQSTFAERDFETTLWKIARAGSGEFAEWPGHDREAPLDHLLVLADLDGNILLQDCRSEEEVAKLMNGVLTVMRPFLNSLLTAVNWIGSDHEAIANACRNGDIYQLVHDLELGL